jgi:hypothetical protein
MQRLQAFRYELRPDGRQEWQMRRFAEPPAAHGRKTRPNHRLPDFRLRFSAMAFRIPLSPLVHQAAWRLDLVQQLLLMHGEDMEPSATLRSSFWEAVPVTFISRTAPHAPPAAWLPALTAAVRTEQAPWILKVLADWPLPDRIPPEAVPWLDDLISVCESQRAAMHLYRDNVASHLYEKTLRALIRLEQINRSPENSPPRPSCRMARGSLSCRHSSRGVSTAPAGHSCQMASIRRTASALPCS